jgi:hypothetical protein
MLFSTIGFLFCIASTIFSVIKASKNNASSFMRQELDTYYLGSRGIR